MHVDDLPGVGMANICVIADDLTGACDSALQFFNVDLRAVVVLSELDIISTGADAIAVSTNSRNCEPDEAYKQVAETVSRMRAAGIRSFYKKIDSGLRGNVGSEINALCNMLDAQAVLVAPSFPALNRTVEQGILLVNGQPLTSTSLARELVHDTCAVAAIIAKTTLLPVKSIALNVIRSGTDCLEKQLEAAVDAGFKVLVCDAVSDSDLTAIAGVLLRHLRWYGVGSAGLAAALARFHSPASGKVKRYSLQPRAGRLVIVGSQHPTARAQLDCLQRTLMVPVLSLSPDALRMNRKHEIERIERDLNLHFRAGTDVALTTELSDLFVRDTETGQSLTRAIGEILSKLIPPPYGLVLVGGDTAAGILTVLEAESAEIIAEVEPGIPALSLRGGPYAGATVITKAGSFGSRESLAFAYQFLEIKL